MLNMKSAYKVSKELGLCYTTLHSWLSSGVIKATLIKHDMRGNNYFFSEEDIKRIEKFWNKRKQIARDRKL